MLKKINLLNQVTGLIHQHRLDCFVTGGFAYDGLRGKISQSHADLDIGFLENNRGPIFQAFQSEGFSILEKSNYKAKR